jgi:hypothetical protein
MEWVAKKSSPLQSRIMRNPLRAYSRVVLTLVVLGMVMVMDTAKVTTILTVLIIGMGMVMVMV